MKSTEHLKKVLDKTFAKRQISENTGRLLELDHIDARLYAIYLVETFHYTSHNTKNQALVATRRETIPTHYQQFCLKHALEESGHELMALHDLNTLGHHFKPDDLSAPLAETQALIAYLYDIAQFGSPYARLGYSFWAEGSYEYIGQSMGMIQQALNLKDSQMTFYKAHAVIDEQHLRDIEDTIERFVKNEQDLKAVEDAMLMSLRLTGLMIDKVVGSYLERVDNVSNRYDYLDKILK